MLISDIIKHHNLPIMLKLERNKVEYLKQKFLKLDANLALLDNDQKEIDKITQQLQEVFNIAELVDKITQAYNANKVAIFKELAARALALGISQKEIKQTMQAIQANFEMMKKFCAVDNVSKFQKIATMQQLEEGESYIQYDHNSQYSEIANLWTETQKEVNKKGDSIRSR